MMSVSVGDISSTFPGVTESMICSFLRAFNLLRIFIQEIPSVQRISRESARPVLRSVSNHKIAMTRGHTFWRAR